MKNITSAHNPIIKHLRKLASSGAYRTKHGQTLLDGVHVCESYEQAGGEFAQVVFGSEARQRGEVAKLYGRPAATNVEMIEVPDSLLATLSGVKDNPGVVGVIDIPQSDELGKLKEAALLLDEVQDPGNLGTILRTAAAAGVNTVVLSRGSASAWSPKVLRAGMGAQFALTMYEGVDLTQVVREASVPVFATSLQATKTLYETDLAGEVAWLFGSEGRGISPELLELCGENTVIIPQNPQVESLNVAAAVAVCLFEQQRQKIAHQ